MIVDIKVRTVATGNPRRGYHDNASIVEFVYVGDSQWTEEREREIVDLILYRKGCMWFTIKNRTVIEGKLTSYDVKHGYDSGD